MTTVVPSDRWHECVPLLRSGEVVAIPTDTVYGIAALPEDAEAIEKIYEAKGRPTDKALPMLVSDLVHAQRVGRLRAPARRLCAACWPGGLTVVVGALPSFHSPALGEDGTVALRMPDSSVARDIIAASGGVLAVTSANLSGQAPATSAAQVLEQLDGRIAAVVDDGASPLGRASTVVRLARGHAQVLREGAVPAELVQEALRGARHSQSRR